MSQRISKRDLERLVERINQLTKSPLTSYTKKKSGRYKANVGNYRLDGAYGGWTLHRMDNEFGGVQDVLRCGHVSKRELYYQLHAFISGLEACE